jgi:hypothetical protein
MTAARMVARLAGPAAGSAGGRVFTERRVPDEVVRLDGPVLTDQAGQILRAALELVKLVTA